SLTISPLRSSLFPYTTLFRSNATYRLLIRRQMNLLLCGLYTDCPFNERRYGLSFIRISRYVKRGSGDENFLISTNDFKRYALILFNNCCDFEIGFTFQGHCAMALIEYKWID